MDWTLSLWNSPLRSLVIALVASSTPCLGQSHVPVDDSGPPSQAEVADPWLAQVSSSLARDEYHFSACEPGIWSAPNRAHDLRIRVASTGIDVFPRGTDSSGAGAEWALRLSTTGFGRRGAVAPLGTAEVRVTDGRAELDHGALVEWFINDERGIEQGWTIAKAPAGAGPLVIGMRVEGDLTAAPGADTAARTFLDAAGGERVRYAGLVAWDATGRELSVELRGAASGLDIHVDDEDAVYPLTVDPLLTNPAWIADSDQPGSAFGGSVSDAGDVNGDGFDDVIVGAQGYDNGEQSEGRAYLYLGSAAGLDASPAWIAEPDQVNAFFGFQVAGAGDVNGDGFDDVLVGAPGFTNGEFREGRAFLYRGSAAGLERTASWTAEVNQFSANFGFSVASAGDVNGDGYADVVIGAQSYLPNGLAVVYHGSAAGLGSTQAWSASSNQLAAAFGSSVSSAGDVNGDGYSDVIIGDPYHSNGQLGEGRVVAFYGSAGGLGLTSAWTAESDSPQSRYGSSVSTAGDVNGDGFSDVLVGAHSYSNGQALEGRAFAYYGSLAGLSSTVGWSVESNQAQANYGISVSSAGDVNGDGYADVIVGAEGFQVGAPPVGRAFVYHGGAAGIDLVEAWSVDAGQAPSQFGKSVSGAGDVNADGYDDVVIGAYRFTNGQNAEGAAFAYHGAPASGPVVYCTAGTSGSGCDARVFTSGVASASALDGFFVGALGVEGSRDGLFFFGAQGRQALPWGGGSSFQCVVPPVERGSASMGSGTVGECDGTLSEDLNALWCSACPKPRKNPGAGTLVQVQLWYQDPLNTSTQASSLSDAIEFLVGP